MSNTPFKITKYGIVGNLTGSVEGTASWAITASHVDIDYDTRLYEDSTNPIENHAVYDQFMTEADVWDMLEEIDPNYFTSKPLSFSITSDGTITRGSLDWIEVEYRLNGGEWTLFEEGDELDVEAGDTVEFRGTYGGSPDPGPQEPLGAPVRSVEGTDSFFSSITCTYSVYGNVLSLLDAERFAEALNFMELFNDSYYYGNGFLNYSNEFMGMFANTPVVDASHLILYPGYLPNYIYAAMFMDCTSLVKAPKLSSMYLAPYCYADMFAGCTSLTTAPTLPATNLPEGCYYEMFSGSSVLNYVDCAGIPETSEPEPEVPTRGLGNEASCSTENWLAGVAETGTFVKNASADWEISPSGIPISWSVQIADSIYIPVPTAFNSFDSVEVTVDDGGGGDDPKGETRGTDTYSVWVASASLPPSAKEFISPNIHMDITGSYSYDDGGGMVAKGGDTKGGDTKGTVTDAFTEQLTFWGSGSTEDAPDWMLEVPQAVMNVVDPNATMTAIASFGNGNYVAETHVWTARGSSGNYLYVVPGVFPENGYTITSAAILDGVPSIGGLEEH